MGFFVSLALGTLGLFIGIVYFSTVFLPLIYGFPKALYLSLRGEMRWMAPLHYLLVALGWLVGWTVIFFGILQIFPGSQKYIVESGAFSLGSMLGTVGGFYRVAVSNASNGDLRDDFSSFTERYVIFLSDDAQKEASLRACSEGMRNSFFFAIGGVIATLFAIKFNNNFVYFAYLVLSYIVLSIFILDIFTKILASASSIALLVAKSYYWIVGDIAKAQKIIGVADVLATITALLLSGMTILVSYISMSIVTPNHWNIFTFIGL